MMRSRTCTRLQVIGLALLLFTVSACSDLLEPKVYDQISPNNFPKSPSDAEALVTGVYSEFIDTGWGPYSPSWAGRLTMSLAPTDEFYCNWGHFAWVTRRKFTWTPSNPAVTSLYFDFTQAATRATVAIDNIEATDMNEELKQRYVAELRVARAYFAYDLYNNYGPVPIITDPEIARDANTDHAPERPTQDEMVNFIETELREAATVLPLSYSGEDFGRFTKGAALMKLLKLHMHEKAWQKAANVSKEIMELGVYDLEDDFGAESYKEIFTVSNEQNEEIIWAVPRTTTQGNFWLAHALPPDYAPPNGAQVQKWNGFRLPWDMYNKYEEDDNRLKVLLENYPTDDGMNTQGREDNPYLANGAVPLKYWPDPSSSGLNHGNDYIVHRYADVLLLRAEALNELNGGPTSEAVDLVNRVRERAGVSVIRAADYTYDTFKDFLLDERFRELFHEGTRRQDLIRFGKFLKQARKRYAPNAQPYHRLYPIPQGALDGNKNLTQNPGY